MKEYFPHDYYARNDPRLQKILMKFGQEGKGIYWDLVEMMYEEGGKLLIGEIDSYAFALRTDSERINSIINDFDLFNKNEVHFWSDSILRRIKIREEKSVKAKESAGYRWNNANAKRTQSERNAIKVNKRKEKEIKKEKVFVYSGKFSEVPELVEAFQEWLEFRKDSGHPVKSELTLKKNLNNINTYDSPEEAIAHINRAISMGWRGLFPKNESNPKNETKQPQSRRALTPDELADKHRAALFAASAEDKPRK